MSQGDASQLEPVWLGVGSPRPQPRVLQNAMFGHVADAFDEKSIFKIGQDRHRMTSQTQSATGDDDTPTTTDTPVDNYSQPAAAVECETLLDVVRVSPIYLTEHNYNRNVTIA